MTPRRINLNTFRGQSGWLIGWMALTLGLASLPFVWGWLMTPPGQQFSGFLFNASDGNTYLAKMEEGRQGSWLFRLVYTSETGGTGAYTYLFYLLLGKLAGLLGLPNILIFHLARLLGGLALLLVSYRFIQKLFLGQLEQRFTFRLVCLSAGLGWLLVLFTPSPPDFWVAEAYTFQSIFANPHFPLATALLIFTINEALNGLEGQGFRAYLKAAAASFALGFVHPFLLFTLAGALGLFWLRLALAHKKMLWPEFFSLILVGLAGTPGPLLTWWGTSRDPLLSRWMQQNQTPSLDLLTLLGAYGLLIPLGVAGAWWVESRLRQSSGEKADFQMLLRWRLVTGWLLVTLVLLVLPFNFSRRFMEGLHLPLCCLAAAGYYRVLAKSAGYRFKEHALTLVLSLSSLGMVIISVALLYLPHDDLYDPVHSPYLSQGELAAIEWLRQNSQPDEVLLTGPLLGNVLPGRVLRPVYYGHNYETLEPQRKLTEVKAFFDPATPPAFREQLIRDGRLNYLVYGWREQAFGGFNPASAGWPQVFSQDGVVIYRLQ